MNKRHSLGSMTVVIVLLVAGLLCPPAGAAVSGGNDQAPGRTLAQ
jgi:hypothetical protein